MIIFPEHIRPQSVTPEYVDYGSLVKPIFGGDILRTNRKGSRFRVSVSLPPIPAGSEGVISDIIRGKSQGMRMLWEQGFDVRKVGSPVIDGDDQQGTSLSIRGFEPNIKLPKDLFFSFEQDSKSRLHILTEAATVDAFGAVTLAIEPELRVLTVDGSTCSFHKPVIDGFVEGDDWAWTISLSKQIGASFDLVERW